ncbi:MAG: BMP family ABC transporter substrate-binding protein, partial [Actinomycetota bacterium]|nr:BMP family ABC transporter substrate-binding protein [Actinomycetota bacterium]
MRGSTLKAVAAVGALAIITAACSSSNPSSSSGGSSPSSSSSSAATTSFKACMVTDTGGINDKSFNAASWAGMQAAAATNPSKIKATYLPSTTSADYAQNISTFLSQGCGIIVTVGFLMADATEQAAKANPNQKFAIVD